MPSPKSADAKVFIGAGDWCLRLARVLDFSITPSTIVTNEVDESERAELATIHGVMQTFEIGTLYDSAETDILRARISDTGGPYCAVIRETPRKNFEAGPVKLLAMPESASQTDAITSSLSLPEYGRHLYGTGTLSVTPFNLTDGDESQAIGNLSSGQHILVIVESLANGPISLVVAGRTRQFNTPAVHNPGPLTGNVNGASITASLSSGESIQGYVLVGSQQELPDG